MNNSLRISSQITQNSAIQVGRGNLTVGFDEITGPVFILADTNVQPYADRLRHALSEKNPVVMESLVISEKRKTLSTVTAVYEKFAQHSVTRDTTVVVIGGGVLSDLGGYAAATYLRGLSWVSVPTTLLAQVDAAIGGKVAVNTEYGKNLVGSFHLPKYVRIDIDTLATLPASQWRAGLGEIIKSSLIQRGALWHQLTDDSLPIVGTVNDKWLDIIEETARIKIDIVNQDLFESNLRMFLNFGHTVAHGLETYFGYGSMSHGEAVGIGTIVALYLSEQTLGLDRAVRQEVMRWLAYWQLPTHTTAIEFDDFYPILTRDKKARAFGLQWVLLEKIGQPKIMRGIDPELVKEALLQVTS